MSQEWHSRKWDYTNVTEIDLNRIRDLLTDVEPSIRDHIVNKLRAAYPTMSIQVTPKGYLRFESAV